MKYYSIFYIKYLFLIKVQDAIRNCEFRLQNMMNFHSKCKNLGGVVEFFSEAFLCRFPPRTFLGRLFIQYTPFQYKSH